MNEDVTRRARPGRPPIEKTQRVREIMRERCCSYGTAYAQFRRERETRAADYLIKYPYLSLRQCDILKLADEVRQLIAEREAQEAGNLPQDPVDIARENLRQAKLAEYPNKEQREAAVSEAAELLAQARSEGAA
jgi:hypothetical protein